MFDATVPAEIASAEIASAPARIPLQRPDFPQHAGEPPAAEHPTSGDKCPEALADQITTLSRSPRAGLLAPPPRALLARATPSLPRRATSAFSS